MGRWSIWVGVPLGGQIGPDEAQVLQNVGKLNADDALCDPSPWVPVMQSSKAHPSTSRTVHCLGFEVHYSSARPQVP